MELSSNWIQRQKNGVNQGFLQGAIIAPRQLITQKNTSQIACFSRERVSTGQLFSGHANHRSWFWGSRPLHERVRTETGTASYRQIDRAVRRIQGLGQRVPICLSPMANIFLK
jgi:hypothetical protein